MTLQLYFQIGFVQLRGRHYDVAAPPDSGAERDAVPASWFGTSAIRRVSASTGTRAQTTVSCTLDELPELRQDIGVNSVAAGEGSPQTAPFSWRSPGEPRRYDGCAVRRGRRAS